MQTIPKSKQAAEVLAETPRKAAADSGFKVVDIVAHSVGSRLTLELLKHLSNAEEILVRRNYFDGGSGPNIYDGSQRCEQIA